jgi:hypothetical protein
MGFVLACRLTIAIVAVPIAVEKFSIVKAAVAIETLPIAVEKASPSEAANKLSCTVDCDGTSDFHFG